MSNGTTSNLGLYIKFQAAVLEQLPRPDQLDKTTLEMWIKNQRQLKESLAHVLVPVEAKITELKRPIIDCDADPFLPNGWKVEEHCTGGQLEWDPAKVRLFLSERQKNGRIIQGLELRKELADQPVLNANVLDFLLANPNLIPEEWKGKHIFFWGTIYRDAGGNLVVRYFDWDGDRWDWDCYWLGFDWDGNDPAALSAS